jgi:hypothetical protein
LFSIRLGLLLASVEQAYHTSIVCHVHRSRVYPAVTEIFGQILFICAADAVPGASSYPTNRDVLTTHTGVDPARVRSTYCL